MVAIGKPATKPIAASSKNNPPAQPAPAPAEAPKKKGGRPAGSKNKPKEGAAQGAPQSQGFGEMLKGLSKQWNKAREEAKKGFGATLPEGQYIASIEAAELNQSQQGRLQVHWTLSILAGDSEGSKVHVYDGIETEQNLEFLGRKLARFGYDVGSVEIENLETILTEIVSADHQLRIQVKEKEGFVNIYFNAVLTPSQRIEKDATETETQETETVQDAPAAEADEPKADEAPEADEADEPEADEAPAEEGESVEIGSSVGFSRNGKELTGTVSKIDEEAGQLMVSVPNIKGLFRVNAADAWLA